MADRVLPSREETAWAAEYGWPEDERWQAILQAYVSGRLVDRETIDYEAAANELWKSFKEQADTLEAAKSIVDAALEV